MTTAHCPYCESTFWVHVHTYEERKYEESQCSVCGETFRYYIVFSPTIVTFPADTPHS